jgi:hypothetical protein
VVDDEFDGLKRIDESGVAAELLHGVAHGGEIDDAGDAGEILEQDATGSEGDFFIGLRVFIPGGHGTDVFVFYVAAVFGAEEIFEKDAERVGEMFRGDALVIEGIEAIDFVFFVTDFKRRAGVESV